MGRISLGEKGGKRFWYPVIKSTGLVKEKKVAEVMARRTALKPKEAELLISQLCEVVVEMLLNGETVQLADLGSFRTTAKTESSECEEEVTVAKIKKLTVRFTESNKLKNTMKKAKFMDVSKLSKKNRI